MPLYERTATFEYEDYPGLEVVMQMSVPLRRYLEISAHLDSLDASNYDAVLPEIAAIVDEFRVSWTLDGEAMDQPGELLVGIVYAWWRAVRRVPVPLPRRSGDTAPSLEPSTDPEP